MSRKTEQLVLRLLRETTGPVTILSLFEAAAATGVEEEEFSLALGLLLGRGEVELTGDQELQVSAEDQLVG